jgi:hypothetical protein
MTTAKTVLVLLLVFAAAASTQGCSVSSYDRRDAAWDPKPGQSLIDQIPNWDGEAQRRCCGHLRQCQANQTPRC